jgi:hypothetical protein
MSLAQRCLSSGLSLTAMDSGKDGQPAPPGCEATSDWTLKEMESLAGLLSFCSMGRTFSQSSYDFIANAARRRSGPIRVPEKLLADSSGGVNCWINSTWSVLLTIVARPTAKSIQTPVTMVLVLLYSRTVPRPNSRLRAKHINVKEVAAAAHAPKRWGPAMPIALQFSPGFAVDFSMAPR